MKYKLPQLSFVGHVPADKQGLRRIMGMVDYLQKFAPGLSELTTSIRTLLGDDAESVWEESIHGGYLKRVRAVRASVPVLTLFEEKKRSGLMAWNE